MIFVSAVSWERDNLLLHPAKSTATDSGPDNLSPLFLSLLIAGFGPK